MSRNVKHFIMINGYQVLARVVEEDAQYFSLERAVSPQIVPADGGFSVQFAPISFLGKQETMKEGVEVRIQRDQVMFEFDEDNLNSDLVRQYLETTSRLALVSG